MGFIEKQGPVKKELLKILLFTLAAFVMAFNITSFVNHAELYPSGCVGITVLIQRIFGEFAGVAIPYSAIFIPLSILPAIIAYKYLSKKFIFYSFYVSILASVLTDIMPRINITDDVLLVTVFGGCLNGIAIVISLIAGGSAGGTDFISIFISEKYGKDGWNYIFVGNVVVLLTAGILFGIDKALYSIIYQFASTQMLNTFYKKYQKHTLWIITEQPNRVYGRIKEITRHDATLFKCIGLYQGAERNMVYSVVSSNQVNSIIRAIKEVDPHAFINVTKTDTIKGNFYIKPNG